MTCVRHCLTHLLLDHIVPQQGASRVAAKGDASKLPVKNAARVARIIALLEAATLPEQLNLPGYRFHGLNGSPKRYAVDASGNYRVTFGWEGENAIDVDLEDYH